MLSGGGQAGASHVPLWKIFAVAEQSKGKASDWSWGSGEACGRQGHLLPLKETLAVGVGLGGPGDVALSQQPVPLSLCFQLLYREVRLQRAAWKAWPSPPPNAGV